MDGERIIDADTEIEPDAISKLVRHFSDPQLGAVAGNVKVGNRSRWLTRWQALEYITSQNMEKRAFDLLNCITVVPGALGAWRKKAIEAAGVKPLADELKLVDSIKDRKDLLTEIAHMHLIGIPVLFGFTSGQDGSVVG